MNRFTIVKFHVYPFDVLVSFHKRFADLEKVLKVRLPKHDWSEIKDMDTGGYARCMMFSSGSMCIWFSNPDTFTEGQVAHEAFHAVHFLMDRINTPLKIETTESYAYCLAYLVDEIISFKSTLNHCND